MKKILVNRNTLVLIFLFTAHLIFSFYNLEKWASLCIDQLDNAWASLRILLVHKYPLVGMVAKSNSGIYIGPLYYYLTSIFYWMTKLDPIASPLLASITRLLSFWVLYFVTKKIFNVTVALASCFIYTFSSYVIFFERWQWPVNFIAPLSLLIFYFLYKIMNGEHKYFIHLAIALGLSFQIHFTSIFYPIILILSLPAIRFNKTMYTYIILLISIVLFSVAPVIYYYSTSHANSVNTFSTYFQTYYHGFHLQRFFQLTHDAFIKYISILELPYSFIGTHIYFLIPFISFIYIQLRVNTHKTKLCYLLMLWTLVPWIVFSTYRGEITDYYFSSQLYVTIFILGYLSVWMWHHKHYVFKGAVIIFWLYYSMANMNKFLTTGEGNMLKNKIAVQNAIQEGRRIEFSDANPQAYLYFYYMYTQKNEMAYEL